MEKKFKLGEPIKIEISSRHYDFTRQFAVKDIFDALVELITNSDDSYGRLYTKNKRSEDGGRILIEIDYRRGDNPSRIIVRDRAEGMTLEQMVTKLARIGDRTSEVGDRGFMARGAKDCTSLGDLAFSSIVSDKFYKCKLLSKKLEFIPLENGGRVDEKLRKELKIDRGNGTVVVLEVEPQHKIPRIETIVRDLPWHYALRDILSEKSDTEVMIRKYGSNHSPTKIVYRYPEGEIVKKEKYWVSGYLQAEAIIEIRKATTLLEDPVDKQRFRKSGLIVKSKRAIHECSLLQPSFENDEDAHYFFGRIDCSFIDTLLEEYDDCRARGQKHPIDNPSLIIDPNRQYGLNRKHPFTDALLKIPTKLLQELIEKEKEEKAKKEKQIANTETKKKLNDLAKAASKFLRQQIEELELSSDESVDNEFFTKRGILIFPTYANIPVDEIRTFSFYVNKRLHKKENGDVTLSSDSKSVEFLDSSFSLQQHPKKSDLLYGKFRVKGVNIEDGICVVANCEGLPKAEALFNVVDNKIEERNFIQPLEFEHKRYKMKEGTKKIIKLYAKFPEVVNKETEVKIMSANEMDLVIRGRPSLIPVTGSNYAHAEITIESRRIVSRPIKVSAHIDEIEATTLVKVVQKEEFGPEIDIKLVDKDFGYFRAQWADLEGKPNLLKIARKHPSISRYLGVAPNFDGQNSTEFKILLAEIVAESVCRKLLRIETEQSSWLFNWADQKEDSVIAESVLYEFNKRMKSFLPIAHSIVL